MTIQEFGDIALDNEMELKVCYEHLYDHWDYQMTLDGVNVTKAFDKFNEDYDNLDEQFWHILHAAGVEEMDKGPCEYGEYAND